MPQQLIFLARGNPPFTLAWGMRGATESALPLSTLVPAYRYQDGLPGDRAQFGLEKNNPTVTPAAANTQTDSATKNRWMLWSVLVVGALLLLLMAWKLIRSND